MLFRSSIKSERDSERDFQDPAFTGALATITTRAVSCICRATALARGRYARSSIRNMNTRPFPLSETTLTPLVGRLADTPLTWLLDDLEKVSDAQSLVHFSSNPVFCRGDGYILPFDKARELCHVRKKLLESASSFDFFENHVAQISRYAKHRQYRGRA